jgi:tetratricopeptide (TPR) repeat protein
MNSLTRLVREVARRNLLQTLGIFLGAGWGVLQVVDLFTERGFLPSWTFAGSLLALILGLPVVLATAWVQGGRSGTTESTSERAGDEAPEVTDAEAGHASGGDSAGPDLERLLTWDRALLGGVLAFALLGVLSAGYMVMRVTGIGAPGTLAAQGTFQVGSRVVLADFESSEDAAPGDLITETLRIDLGGSEAFELVARGDVVGARELMRVVPDQPLDEEVAREVAVRLGAPGLISGEVGRVGSSYVITSHLRDAESGDELASFRQTARDSTGLIDAIDRLAAEMRAKVGESLRSVASRESLSAVTTTSLEALRKYTYVSSRIYRGEIDITVGQALLEEAIALDSTFATANISLAISINNWGGSQARSSEAAAQAFRHRERLSERERYQVEAYYYSQIGDVAGAMQAYRRILEVDPTARSAANNLADLNMYEGDYEEAVELLRGNPSPTSQPWWWNLTSSLAALGRVDEALAVFDSAEVTLPESYPEFSRPLMLAVAGEQEMAEAALADLPEPPAGWDGWVGFVRSVVAVTGGNVALARELIGGMSTAAGQEGAVTFQMDLAVASGWTTAWVEREPERAVATVDALLVGVDLESVPAQDRSYPALAMLYAAVGDQERFEAVAARFRGEVDVTADPFGWARIDAAEALLAIRPGGDAALARVEAAVRDIHCDRCGDAIVGIGAEAAGRPERAIEAYERYLAYRFYDGGMLLTHLLATNIHERLGELYEEVGDPVMAAQHYRAFADLWRNADPALQPRAERARARAMALGGG